MKIKYCLPIIKGHKQEIVKTIEENINNFDYFELWLDYIDDLDDMFIRKIIQIYDKNTIFLFRRKNLEAIRMSMEKRKNIIFLLLKSRSLVDFDINQQKEELEHIRKNNLKLSTIVSYHNYDETPTDEKLNDIVDIITKYKPKILKISTLCKIQEDSLRLLELIPKLKNKNIKYIISGMGKNGKYVKLMGAEWGNEMTFAPISVSEQSAPGQLTKTQLETIFKILNTKY